MIKHRLLLLVLIMGISYPFVLVNAKNTYYSNAKITVSSKDPKSGLVYIAADANTSQKFELYKSSSYIESLDTKEAWTSLGLSARSVECYVWAQAARGYKFNGWTSDNVTVTSSSGTGDKVTMTAKYSSDKNKQTTGTIAAEWTPLSPCKLTFHASPYGSYVVQYSYLEVTDEKIDTYGGKIIVEEDGAVTSGDFYSTDKVTLIANADNFKGWYKGENSTTPISEEKEYEYAVSEGVDASIYAKFDEVTQYYGQVTAELSPYSTTDGGVLYASTIEGVVGAAWSTTSVARQSSTTSGASQTYYLYAKSNDPSKYIFAGWYDEQGNLCGSSEEMSVGLQPTSTEKSAPTSKTIYARFIRLSEHYLEVTAMPKDMGTGMVYVTEESGDNPPFDKYAAIGSRAMASVKRFSAEMPKGTVYVHAYPKYGYIFAGWYTDVACTDKVSDEAHYAYQNETQSTDPTKPTQATLYAKFVAANPINITFTNTANGTYVAKVRDVIVENGEYVWGYTQVYESAKNSEQVQTAIYPTPAITMEATPDVGMGVESWTDGSKTVTTTSLSYATDITTAKTIGVTIQESKPFRVGSTDYSTLAEAIDNLGTNKQITVVKDCRINETCTIPNGVTLLIPKDENNKISTKPGEITSGGTTTLTKYREVALAPDAHLTINGALCIDGNQYGSSAGPNPGCGSVVGGYGCLNMANGGKITIGSTGKLYAFGFIFGKGDQSESGTITVESGGEVYEDFVIMDMHGGGGTAAIINAEQSGKVNKNKRGVFIFNQYYVQNIEPKMTLKKGAKEYVYFFIDASGETVHEKVNYIGDDDSFLFSIGEAGSITKWYDANTDRLGYEIQGAIAMNSISVKISAMNITMTIESKDYDLPINNMDIVLAEGAKVTLNYNLKILPGTRMTVAKGAELIVGKNLYLYDYQDWGKFSMEWYVQPITTTPGHSAANSRKPTNAATLDKLGQAELVIDGNVTVGASGNIYTTTHGANIYSHGTGKLRYIADVPNKDSAIYEIEGIYGNNSNILIGEFKVTILGASLKSYSVYGTPISCTPAMLRNANNTFYQTKGKLAGTTIRYVDGSWMVLSEDGCFYKDELNHLYVFTDEDDFTEVVLSTDYDGYAWEVVDAPGVLYIHTASDCNWTKAISDEATKSTTKLLKDYTGNEYYQYSITKGYWEKVQVWSVTFKNYNGSVLQDGTIYSGGKPTYNGLTPVLPADEQGSYAFVGWKREGDETLYSSNALPEVNENTIFEAQYKYSPYVASVNSLGVTYYHSKWSDALEQANSLSTNPTLKLLTDVKELSSPQTISKSMTLDLNGHELSGTVSGLVTVNMSDGVVTITDDSTDKKSKISSVGTASSGNYYTISVTKGQLILRNGNVYGSANGANVFVITVEKNGSFTMNGGKITTTAKEKVNGILTKNNNTILLGGYIDVPASVVYISNGYSVEDKMQISGGYFKGKKVVQDATSTAKVNITGGYFGTDVNLADCVVEPYHVVGCSEEDLKDTYPHEVAEAYEVRFVNAGGEVLQKGYVKQGDMPEYNLEEPPTKASTDDYEYQFSGWEPAISSVNKSDQTYTAQFTETPRLIGKPLDIVDWKKTDDGKTTVMTVNFNGVAASIWPLTIKVGDADENEKTYERTDRNTDRTMDIPYSGKQDADLKIKVTDKDGNIYSQHSYVIPQVYEADATLGNVREDGHSIIFVRKGKLTVDQDAKVGAVYVAPGAELEISSGATLTVDSLMLRTTPWEAAILTNNGTISAGKVYYTRIVSDMVYYQFALPLGSNIADVRLSNYANFPYERTWLLKRYDEKSRANKGVGSGSNWVQLNDGDDIVATKGYELFSGSAYYREIYFPVALPGQLSTQVTVSHTDGEAGAAHSGWNALCSPLLGKYTQKFATPSSAVKVSRLTESGNYYQCIPEVIYPAVPFYYQAPEGGTLDFSGDELILKAPQRAWNTSVSEQWLRLTIGDQAGTAFDETNIFVHPEKFSVDYEPGYDVAKQSLTASTAALYSVWPCGALAFAAIPDSVAAERIPLTVGAGKAGEYTFSLQDNDYLERIDHVFLYDVQTGAVTDLLGSDYTTAIPQGTAAGRFYIRCVFAPVSDTATGLPTFPEDLQTDHVQKFLYNNRVYILRNGVLYDLTGRQCQIQ